MCPIDYIKGIDRSTTLKYRLKNCLNWLQFRIEPRVKKAAKRANLVFCDSYSGVTNFKDVYGIDSLQINESGCHECGEIVRDKIVGKDTMDILWVGRFIPTKLLDIALKSVAIAKPNSNIKLHILGSGNLEKEYKTTAESLGVMDICVWHGQVPHDEVQRIMRSCDLLFYTSIVDGTPASIMECISNGLPILCFDTCGFGPMVDESIGSKIQLSNPDQSVREFAEKIQYLYDNRSVLQQMSDNCKEKISKISWDALAKRIVGLYNNL
jgi:glycosyltransferase involved in cell wall biosynthesis